MRNIKFILSFTNPKKLFFKLKEKTVGQVLFSAFGKILVVVIGYTVLSFFMNPLFYFSTLGYNDGAFNQLILAILVSIISLLLSVFVFSFLSYLFLRRSGATFWNVFRVTECSLSTLFFEIAFGLLITRYLQFPFIFIIAPLVIAHLIYFLSTGFRNLKNLHQKDIGKKEVIWRAEKVVRVKKENTFSKLSVLKKLILTFTNPKKLFQHIEEEDLFGTILYVFWVSLFVMFVYSSIGYYFGNSPFILGDVVLLPFTFAVFLSMIGLSLSVVVASIFKIFSLDFQKSLRISMYSLIPFMLAFGISMLFVGPFEFLSKKSVLIKFFLVILPPVLSFLYFIYLEFKAFAFLAVSQFVKVSFDEIEAERKSGIDISSDGGEKVKKTLESKEDFEARLNNILIKGGVDTENKGSFLDTIFVMAVTMIFASVAFWVFGEYLVTEVFVESRMEPSLILFIMPLVFSLGVIKFFRSKSFMDRFVNLYSSIALNSKKYGIFAHHNSYPMNVKGKTFLCSVILIVCFLILSIVFVSGYSVVAQLIFLVIFGSNLFIVLLFGVPQIFIFYHPDLIKLLVERRYIFRNILVALIIFFDLFLITSTYKIFKDMTAPIVEVPINFEINGCGNNTMLDEDTNLCWLNSFPATIIKKEHTNVDPYCHDLDGDWRSPKPEELQDLFKKFGAKKRLQSNETIITKMREVGFNMGDHSEQRMNYYLDSFINPWNKEEEGYVVLYNGNDLIDSKRGKEYSVACMRSNK